MKTVKSLLLGSAAAFVAFTGAQAADLPMAEPVEYVKVCDTYGKGFFYIPGTDTCLKVGGFVRFDQRYDFGDDGNLSADALGVIDPEDFVGSDASERYSNRARLSIKLDARSETEWGTLRSFLEFRSDADSDAFQNDGGGDDFVESAYIQFAGFTVGRTSSFYDFVETATVADYFSDNQVNTVAYTWSFGDGFSATVGIENAATRFLGTRAFVVDEIVGDDNTRDAPAGIAALRVEQAWGSAQLSAAVKDNEGDDNIITTDPADLGWAVQAGVAINLPTAVEGSYVWAQGTYAEGAADYGFLGTFLQTSIDRADFNIDGESTEQWAVGGGVNFQATETVALYGSAAYIDYDAKGGPEGSFEAIQATAGILWKPVSNLNIFLEGTYVTADFDDVSVWDGAAEAIVDGDEDDLRIQSRIQRNF